MKLNPDQVRAQADLEFDQLMELAWDYLDRPEDVSVHQIFNGACEIIGRRISTESPVGQMQVVLLLDRFLAVVRHQYNGKPFHGHVKLKQVVDALRTPCGPLRRTGLVDAGR